MYCVPADVREWNQELTTAVIKDSQLETFILRATNIVKMHLFTKYTSGSLITDSWCGIPTPKDDNNGLAVLYGGSAGASAYTEQWTITCATTAFSVTGNLQGSFSNCAYTSHFTCTDLSVSASAWGGTPTANDVYYIRTYDVYPAIVTVTAMLAAGYALNSKYAEEVPNASTLGDNLIRDGMDMLKRMADPMQKDGLAYDSGAVYGGDKEPIPQSYQINIDGEDVTKYYSDRGKTEGETLMEND